MIFVYINDNYRVNIESIFSLEKKRVFNKVACEEYNKNLDIISQNIVTNPPTLNCDGTLYNPINDDEKDNNPLFIIYSEKLKDYIMDQIGDKPDEYINEYWIILSTGIKVQIAEDKFNLINKIIDQEMKNGKS